MSLEAKNMTEVKSMETDIIGLDEKPDSLNDRVYVAFRKVGVDESVKLTLETKEQFVPTVLSIPKWMIFARKTIREDGVVKPGGGFNAIYDIIKDNNDDSNSVMNPYILNQKWYSDTIQLTRYNSWLALSQNPNLRPSNFNPPVPMEPNCELLAHEDDVKLLQDYIDYWANKLIKGSSDGQYNEENYVVEAPIESECFKDYVKDEFDQNLIIEFVNKRVNELKDYDIRYDSADKNKAFTVYTKVLALNRTILFLENYLGMIYSFTSKLYMCVATNMWKTSMLDLTEVSGDKYFKEFQDTKASEWEIQNPEKMKTVKEAIKQAEALLEREEKKNPERIKMAEAAIADAKRRIKEAKEKAEKDAIEFKKNGGQITIANAAPNAEPAEVGQAAAPAAAAPADDAEEEDDQEDFDN